MTKLTTVVVPVHLRRTILAAARRVGGDETGGALVGYRLRHRSGRDVWLVRTYLPAGPQADRGPAHVTQGGLYQAALFRLLQRHEGRRDGTGGEGALWLEVSGPSYLGDWHSHPRGPSRPSAGDRATVARLLLEEPRLPGLVVAIAGTRSGRWRLGVYLALAGPEGAEPRWTEECEGSDLPTADLDELRLVEPWPSPGRLQRSLSALQRRRRLHDERPD